jgi:hypothetical protein
MIKNIVGVLVLGLIFCSCAVLDFPARFLGYSVQKFEDEKAIRYQRNFEVTKTDAFDRTLLIIKYLKARVTHKSFDKGYIVAFDFAISFKFTLDSTEAAFFIKELDDKTIQATVVSDNSLLARSLAEQFFQLFSSTMSFLPEQTLEQNSQKDANEIL